MILLYHLVFPDSTPQDAWNAGLILRLSYFKRQLLWLKKNYSILSLDDYMNALSIGESEVEGKYAITFDDGYRNVIDLVCPFLIEEGIPATFFVTTSHLEDHELLWFVYINALCSEKCYKSIEIEGISFPLKTYKSSLKAWERLIKLARDSKNPIEYVRALAIKYPLTAQIISKYEGITENQIQRIGKSPFISLGGHTHKHPYLDQITKDEQLSQILINKEILESLSGKTIKFFAYTGGLYNQDTLDVVKKLGFSAAFATEPRTIGNDICYEMPRVDIYSPSLIKFKVKALGYQKVARKFLLYTGIK